MQTPQAMYIPFNFIERLLLLIVMFSLFNIAPVIAQSTPPLRYYYGVFYNPNNNPDNKPPLDYIKDQGITENDYPSGACEDCPTSNNPWSPCNTLYSYESTEAVPPTGHIYFTCNPVYVRYDWFGSATAYKSLPDKFESYSENPQPRPGATVGRGGTGSYCPTCLNVAVISDSRDSVLLTIKPQVPDQDYYSLGYLPAGWYSMKTQDAQGLDVYYDFSITEFNLTTQTSDRAKNEDSPYGTLLLEPCFTLDYMRLHKQAGIGWLRTGMDLSDEFRPGTPPTQLPTQYVDPNDELQGSWYWYEAEQCKECLTGRSMRATKRCAMNRAFLMGFNQYISPGGAPEWWHEKWADNYSNAGNDDYINGWSWRRWVYAEGPVTLPIPTTPSTVMSRPRVELYIDAKSLVKKPDGLKKFPPDKKHWRTYTATMKRIYQWSHELYGIKNVEFMEEPFNANFQGAIKYNDIVDHLYCQIDDPTATPPFVETDNLMDAGTPAGASLKKCSVRYPEIINILNPPPAPNDPPDKGSNLYWSLYPAVTALQDYISVLPDIAQDCDGIKFMGVGDITGEAVSPNAILDYALNGHTYIKTAANNNHSAVEEDPRADFLQRNNSELISTPTAATDALELNVLTYHPYWDESFPELAINSGEKATYDLKQQVESLKEIYMRRGRRNTPELWATEFGPRSSANTDGASNSSFISWGPGEAQQAALMPRMHIALFEAGYSKAFLYTLMDWRGSTMTEPYDNGSSTDPTNPSKYFYSDYTYHVDKTKVNQLFASHGIYRAHGVAKPSYLAYKTMTEQLGKSPIVSFNRPTSGKPYYWAEFNSNGQPVFVVWKLEPGYKNIRFKLPSAWTSVLVTHNDGSHETGVGLRGGVEITLQHNEVTYIRKNEPPTGLAGESAPKVFLNRYDGVFLHGYAYSPSAFDAPCWVVIRNEHGKSVSIVKTSFVRQDLNLYVSTHDAYPTDRTGRLLGAHEFVWLVSDDAIRKGQMKFYVEVYNSREEAQGSSNSSGMAVSELPLPRALQTGVAGIIPQATASNISPTSSPALYTLSPIALTENLKPIVGLDGMDDDGYVTGYAFDPNSILDAVASGSTNSPISDVPCEVGFCIGTPYSPGNTDCITPSQFASQARTDLQDLYGLPTYCLNHGFAVKDPQRWQSIIAGAGYNSDNWNPGGPSSEYVIQNYDPYFMFLEKSLLMKDGSPTTIYAYGIDLTNPGVNNSSAVTTTVMNYRVNGQLDAVDECTTVITGWATDPNSPDKTVDVQVVFYPLTPGAIPVVRNTKANIARSDGKLTEPRNNGFQVVVPKELHKAEWFVEAYAFENQIPHPVVANPGEHDYHAVPYDPAGVTYNARTNLPPLRKNEDGALNPLNRHLSTNPCLSSSAQEPIVGQVEGINEEQKITGWYYHFANATSTQPVYPSYVYVCNNLPEGTVPNTTYCRSFPLTDDWLGNSHMYDLYYDYLSPTVAPYNSYSTLGFSIKISDLGSITGTGIFDFRCLQNNKLSAWAYTPSASFTPVKLYPEVEYKNVPPVGYVYGVKEKRYLYGWTVDPNVPASNVKYDVTLTEVGQPSATFTANNNTTVEMFPPATSIYAQALTPGFKFDLLSLPLGVNKSYEVKVRAYQSDFPSGYSILSSCDLYLEKSPLIIHVDQTGLVDQFSRKGTEYLDTEISIFPIPASDEVAVSGIPLTDFSHAYITTVQGKILTPAYSFKNGLLTIRTDNISNGYYNLHLVQKDEVIVRHLLIQR